MVRHRADSAAVRHRATTPTNRPTAAEARRKVLARRWYATAVAAERWYATAVAAERWYATAVAAERWYATAAAADQWYAAASAYHPRTVTHRSYRYTAPTPAPAPRVYHRTYTAPAPRPTYVAPTQGSGRCGGSLPPCYVMMRESHGSLTARNPSSTAAGKWQFLASTWQGYGGYSSAAQAPESVQDARAAQVWAGGAGCSAWSAC